MKTKQIIVIYICLIFTSLLFYPIYGYCNLIEVNNNIQGNWTRVVVDSSLDGSHNIIIENVDDDNKPDLLACAYRDEVVVWYKQPDDPVNDPWTKYVIDPDLPNAHDIQVGDIDGDGLKDVIGLSLSESWYDYNLGNGSLTWYKKPVIPTDSWTKTVIAESGNTGLLGARSAGVGDIDSDGDLDITVAVDTHKYSSQGRLFWYENPGGINALNPDLWNEYLLDDAVGTGADAQIGDIDQDGNPDIVYSGNYGSPTGTFIYFAPSDPTYIEGWDRVSIAGNSYHVYLIDFDEDNDTDVLRASAFDNLVSFLENPYPIDPRIPGNWNEYIIEQDPSIHIANRVSTADIDGDQDLDIGMNADPSQTSGIFKWYRRPDDPKEVDSYEIYVIDHNPTYTAYAHDSCLADIDMDGDVDMAGVGPNALGGTILWWINEVKPDLKCIGNLIWTNVKSGETVYGICYVENIGGQHSLLDWEISETPNWGDWSFSPNEGDDLSPGNQVQVDVEVVAPPNTNQEFSGFVKVINKENPEDYYEMYVYLKTPRHKAISNPFLQFLQNHPNLFPLLQKLILHLGL
jgi:hypothetical protein